VPELEVELEPVLELEPEVELEPVLDLESEAELEPVLDLESEAELEPVLDLEPLPELEPVLELEPEPDLEPLPELELELEPEPEAVLEPEPELEIEPVLEPVPELEIEPVLELDSEPVSIAAAPASKNKVDSIALEISKLADNIRYKMNVIETISHLLSGAGSEIVETVVQAKGSESLESTSAYEEKVDSIETSISEFADSIRHDMKVMEAVSNLLSGTGE